MGFSGAAGGVVCAACEAGSFPLGGDAHRFMSEALGQALSEVPQAPAAALGQVERAIAATLEHHARAPDARGRALALRDILSAMDEGAPIAYELLDAGVPVIASDGEQVGTVGSVLSAPEKDIFHGLLIYTQGRAIRFVEASLVASIHEHGVDLSIDSAQARQLPEPEHKAPVFDEDPGEMSGRSTGCTSSRAKATTGNASEPVMRAAWCSRRARRRCGRPARGCSPSPKPAPSRATIGA